MNALVITTANDGTSAEQRMIIAYENAFHRRWLSKHCWWAFNNNRTVTITATKDPVTFQEKEPKSGG